MIIPSHIRLAGVIVTAGLLQAAPALAMDPCGLIRPQEAAALLGVPATAGVAEPAGCLIRAAGRPEDRVQLSLATVAPQDAAKILTHMDEARGDEIPSMHGDPWYEISAIDPARTLDRIVIIHRDRSILTVSLHTAPDTDQQAAVAAVWLDIARRLPTDD